MASPDLNKLVSRFRVPETCAIALMGSHARGDAGPYSDVDFVRFTRDRQEPPEKAETHLVDGRQVVVSDVPPSAVGEWFTEPAPATECIAGVRTAKPLWDPEGYFQGIQARARDFVWDEEMQARANRWASREMVGWAEEAYKGLAGLESGHVGRLLGARFGLSWGLTSVMRVQRGVLVSGDNGSYLDVVAAIGPDTPWASLSREAFGLTGLDLAGQVRAGLALYVLTEEMLREDLVDEGREVIKETVGRIRTALVA